MFVLYETGDGHVFPTSVGQATFRGVAQSFLGSGGSLSKRKAGPTFDWTSLDFWKRKTYEIYDKISSTILLQKLHGNKQFVKNPMVSSNNFVAAKFLRRIDSMCVMVIHVGEHKY